MTREEVFKKLKDKGVARVVVEFSGGGDEGREEICFGKKKPKGSSGLAADGYTEVWRLQQPTLHLNSKQR